MLPFNMWMHYFQAPFLTRTVKRVIRPSSVLPRRIIQAKINAENKYLFGNLLKENLRRKFLDTSVKVFPFVNENVDKFSVPSALQRMNRRFSRVVHSASIAKNPVAPIENIQTGNADLESYKQVFTDTIKMQLSDTAYSSKDVPIQMPDSIINNLISFPMMVKSKQKETKTVLLPKVTRLFPPVTKILNDTRSEASKAALEKWRKSMIEKLGVLGFENYYADLLQNGKDFHSLIQNYLENKELDVTSNMEGCWSSLSSVLNRLKDVEALERQIIHPWLLYKGVLDCVIKFDDKLMLVEWKKSEKRKLYLHNTYDAPLQMSAYIGALNSDPSVNFKVKGGVVVVAYTDGSPAQVFSLTNKDCLPYWSAWLLRLQQYWKQKKSTESGEKC